MPDICLYFQVHQPNRLRASVADCKSETVSYEHDEMNAEILGRVADRYYLPANRMFKKLIEDHGGRFRMALSISATVIDQMERHRSDVLESFQELVSAGGVELLAETYHYSLAFLHSNKEFDRQVDLHLEKIEALFHVRPRVFRNTELIYNDAIAAKAETLIVRRSGIPLFRQDMGGLSVDSREIRRVAGGFSRRFGQSVHGLRDDWRASGCDQWHI